MLRRFIFQQCVERRFGLPCVRFDRVKLLHGYSARHVGRQLLALFWSECRLPLDRTNNRSPFSASQIAASRSCPRPAGEWYVNVHTQANPNGEIRGQVMPPKN
jgi:hypothetical protein